MNRICPCGRVYSGEKCRKCHPQKKKDVSYPPAWKALSERFRSQNPLCADCSALGYVSPSEEVHHIVPISKDPTRIMDTKNLVALCRQCHKRRHSGGENA